MENELLDFVQSDELAGFRLHRLEVRNWGTFHQHVWSIHPEGKNALLTGDIGSGKSTLVDAVTTLLVPRVAYNKAAGADARERSVRSYSLGYYKSERTDEGLGVKPVALRDHKSYSVLLAHFHSEGLMQDVTLAQVFWFRDPETPSRFYVVAKRPLSITKDFSDFGTDIADLRKRLRRDSAIALYDNFRPYAADFRRRFGIESDQALDLFHQTVSMKSVGNLTEFVRDHMLEAFDAQTHIQELIGHFDDLDRAHAAVLKARKQIEALKPMVDDLDQFDDTSKDVAQMKACRESLRPWFAKLKGELLQERIERLDLDLQRVDRRIDRLRRQLTEGQRQRDGLKEAIAKSGGDRLERLEEMISSLKNEVEKRRQQEHGYRELASQLGLDAASDDDTFLANRRALDQILEETDTNLADIENRMVEAKVNLRDFNEEHQKISGEIKSLRSRRSNIPSRMLEIRARLVEAIGATEQEIPFAGELIQVRQREATWEGAIERLLHNFGLSLLVPDRFYRAAAQWVDRTHLGWRVVYFRVPKQAAERPVDLSSLDPASLLHKLDLRIKSEFHGWLERELIRRFNYICCDDLDRFRREERAMTKAGQIKGGGGRHEKDDRHAIDDRSRYVLGWTNEAKIKALEVEADTYRRRGEELLRLIDDDQMEKKRLDAKKAAIIRFHTFDRFETIDWKSVEIERQRLITERDKLAASSDRLLILKQELDALEGRLKSIEEELSRGQKDHGAVVARRDVAQDQLQDVQSLLGATPPEVQEQYFPLLETMRAEALGDAKLTVESCQGREGDMRAWLQGKIDAQEKRLSRLKERIIEAMHAYKTRWPIDSRDVDARVEAGDEYRAMLGRLIHDDLPRFEAKFKESLQVNTIREIAGFHSKLRQEESKIRDRIEMINRSLKEINYDTGRYIELVVEPTRDAEIREFLADLRACTEGALTGSEDDQYSEAKFHQVKAIIERFRGREGLTKHDRDWTDKVTDVRHWFYFSASEKWREDDSEYEHYTDSGGKSGGQKEKLAYTVLAAGLAYQFGLERGAIRSRSFRFVVIDEAFGRGSDESARYGLDLFQRLNLQVLVVTPLQKIHVIEPYVSTVSLVQNAEGKDSKIRNLTIEEYQSEKAARQWVKLS